MRGRWFSYPQWGHFTRPQPLVMRTHEEQAPALWSAS